jgi:hypothetical protein
MPRKPLSQERKISAQAKKLGLTLAELKAEIDAGNGQLKRDIRLNRKGNFIRLIIRCRRKDLPECWAMAMLHKNVCIETIDFHQTDYRDTEGIKRIGWHRDLREYGGSAQKVCVSTFDPRTLDEFIVAGLAIFNIIVKPGENVDAHGQLQIPT